MAQTKRKAPSGQPGDAAANVPATGRLSTVRSRNKKKEIIAAFKQVLVEEGHANLSMRRIADACGMKLGNLQYYYPTRDDLIDAFVEDWIRIEQAERMLLISENLTPLEAILKWLDDAFVHLTKHNYENGVTMVSLWTLTCHDERARVRQRQWYSEQRKYYGKMVEAAQPGLTKVAAQERAAALMALFEGLVIQFVIHNSTQAKLSRVRQALRSAAEAIVTAPAD